VDNSWALNGCLIAGALVQCALILKARRFPPAGWALALALLLVPPALWFGFITICSTMNDAADSLLIGLAGGITVASMYVMEQAPTRLTATGLVSLTVTFWAAQWPAVRHADWFFLAVLMSAAVLVLTFGPWTPPKPARLALYAWSMVAAASIAAGSLTWKMLNDTNTLNQNPEERLAPIQAVLIGAQFFVFMELVTGLILIIPFDERRKGDPRYVDHLISSYDAASRPSPLGIGLILLQTAALIIARRSGATLENEAISISLLAALGHGALTGEDAGAAPPRSPDIDGFLGRTKENRLDFKDAVLLDELAVAAAEHWRRWRWLAILAVAAALAYGLCGRR